MDRKIDVDSVGGLNPDRGRIAEFDRNIDTAAMLDKRRLDGNRKHRGATSGHRPPPANTGTYTIIMPRE
jgi:hypothetical protein